MRWNGRVKLPNQQQAQLEALHADIAPDHLAPLSGPAPRWPLPARAVCAALVPVAAGLAVHAGLASLAAAPAADVGFPTLLSIKIAYGAVLAAIVTPLMLRYAIGVPSDEGRCARPDVTVRQSLRCRPAGPPKSSHRKTAWPICLSATRPCGYVAPAQQVGAMDLVGRLGESVLPVIVCV